MNTVELEQVTKRFGDTVAVNDVSLTVPQGSIYGFIGPNGSGKTTTMRMIMNFFYPDQGGIRVFGQGMAGASTGRIGYLPEERGLYRRMKVREILRFFAQLKSGHAMDREVDEWLQRFGLIEWADKKVEALSKGMSQKVQFIAAVVFRPELVILDEPFSGLDPVNAEVVRAAVLQLREQGTTIILSTHDMSIAEKMCDFIFMIFKGRKVLDGTLSSIKSQYGSDTIRVKTTGGLGVLNELPDVESVRDFGQIQELRLNKSGDPQRVLSTLILRTQIQQFEITQPSLHDIFVRIAGPADKEVKNA